METEKAILIVAEKNRHEDDEGDETDNPLAREAADESRDVTDDVGGGTRHENVDDEKDDRQPEPKIDDSSQNSCDSADCGFDALSFAPCRLLV